MEKMHDLDKQESHDADGKTVPGIPGPSITLSTSQIPELGDFGIDETIELHIKGKAVNILKPEMNDNEQKSNEPTRVTISLSVGGVMNPKEGRKNADRMGIDKKMYDEIQNRRGSGPIES